MPAATSRIGCGGAPTSGPKIAAWRHTLASQSAKIASYSSARSS
jgi:hypothetical protein